MKNPRNPYGDREYKDFEVRRRDDGRWEWRDVSAASDWFNLREEDWAYSRVLALGIGEAVLIQAPVSKEWESIRRVS